MLSGDLVYFSYKVFASRLLAAQMTSVGIGPGVREVREKNQKIPLPRVESDDDDEKDLEVGSNPVQNRGL